MIYKDHFWIGNFLIYDVTKTTWGVSWVHMTTCIIVPFFISKCYGLWDKRKKIFKSLWWYGASVNINVINVYYINWHTLTGLEFQIY